jgi:hypothetical protein
MCALMLGGVVGCLDDPYYIGDNDALSASEVAAPGNSSPPNNSAPPSATDTASDGTTSKSVPSRTASDTDVAASSNTGTPPATHSVLNTGDDAGAAANEANDSGSDESDAGPLADVEGALVQGHCWPMCYMADTDDVLDGWGTQYERSCVRQGTDAPACDYRDQAAGFLLDGDCYAPCPGELLDDDDGNDSDGWAEHNGEACVVTGTELAQSADTCPHP